MCSSARSYERNAVGGVPAPTPTIAPTLVPFTNSPAVEILNGFPTIAPGVSIIVDGGGVVTCESSLRARVVYSLPNPPTYQVHFYFISMIVNCVREKSSMFNGPLASQTVVCSSVSFVLELAGLSFVGGSY